MSEREAWDTVQHDDGRLRVTRWDVPVGAAIAEHTHGHDYVVVPLVDGKMGITPRGGEPFTSEVGAGVSYAREAGASHIVANAGDEHLAFVEVELLDTGIGVTAGGASPPAGQTASVRLAALGLELPPVPTPVGGYVPAVEHEGLIRTTGQLAFVDGSILVAGLLGDEVDVPAGIAAAQAAGLNAIAAAADAAGGIDRLGRILELTGHLACVPDFREHSRVLDGASDLIRAVFGPDGAHVRTNIGTSALPLGSPAEIGLLVTVR